MTAVSSTPPPAGAQRLPAHSYVYGDLIHLLYPNYHVEGLLPGKIVQVNVNNPSEVSRDQPRRNNFLVEDLAPAEGGMTSTIVVYWDEIDRFGLIADATTVARHSSSSVLGGVASTTRSAMRDDNLPERRRALSSSNGQVQEVSPCF